MRTFFVYAIYLSFSFVLLFFIQRGFFPPFSSRAMVTIMLYSFIWAASVTQVVGVGKLMRRQKEKENGNI